jgi:AraC-like DNA-binding protein
MGTELVATISARMLMKECEKRGVAVAQLLDDAGVNATEIQTASHIEIQKSYLLWEKATLLTTDDMLSLHVAEKVPFGAYRVFDYMSLASDTPRQALLRTSDFFKILNSAVALKVVPYRDIVYIELHNANGPRYLPRPYIEYLFTNLVIRFSLTSQVMWRPIEIHMACSKPDSLDEYQRVFQARALFEQPVNRMVVSRSMMDVQQPFGDPELCEVLEDHARQRLHGMQTAANSLAEIHAALKEGLETGLPTLMSLSRLLAKSRRSLQRELCAHGTSFREELDRVRYERALTLLRDPDLPVSKIATHLMFSDVSSFTGAFQRWTGLSPKQHRKNS